MQAARPNILLIVTDQFRHNCLSSLKHPAVKTPNLDQLASEGVLFTRAYAASMACGPARACLFTGRFSDAHGQLNNQIDLNPADIPVLPEMLAEAGYETALVGKLHMKPMRRKFGFRYCLRHDAPYTNYSEEECADSAYVKYLQQGPFKDDPQGIVERFTDDEGQFPDGDEERFILGRNLVAEEDHEVPWAVRESINYLKNERNKDKPFFLNTSFYGPHQPMLCPGPWEKMYPPDSFPLPEGFDYPVDDKPILVTKYRDQRIAKGWTEETYRKMFSAYYGYVSMIDHYLGQLFNTLKEEGLWDNTLILFTADHGEYLGQFRRFYKGGPYEGSTHVPFIVRDPRSGASNWRCDKNISAMDIFATCLRAADAPIPTDTDSGDLSDIIAGRAADWDNTIRWKSKDESMIVRNDLKLCRATRDDLVQYECYDLQRDPWEAVNRVADPAYAARITEMKDELDSWHAAQNRMRGSTE
jgi:arylsulfatase A-like enzyme